MPLLLEYQKFIMVLGVGERKTMIRCGPSRVDSRTLRPSITGIR
jgi:hypothetical protein